MCVLVGKCVHACACFKHTDGQMGRDVVGEGYWRGVMASPPHLSIKTAELPIQRYSQLTGCAHTQAAHTLSTHLETLLCDSLSPNALKMPCVSSHLDQMVKMAPSYSSVVDKILMVRPPLQYFSMIVASFCCDVSAGGLEKEPVQDINVLPP